MTRIPGEIFGDTFFRHHCNDNHLGLLCTIIDILIILENGNIRTAAKGVEADQKEKQLEELEHLGSRGSCYQCDLGDLLGWDQSDLGDLLEFDQSGLGWDQSDIKQTLESFKG